MKLRSRALLALALAASGIAHAREAVVGRVGRSTDAEAADPAAWLRREFIDWRRPNGAPLATQTACGLRLSYRLVGTRRGAWLLVDALAQAPAHWEQEAGMDLAPGDHLLAALPLPDKIRLGGRPQLHLPLPIRDCSAEATLAPPQGLTEDPATRQIWSQTQLGIETGLGLARTGELQNVISSGFEFGLSVMRYPWFEHGFWIGLQFQNLGSTAGVTGLALYAGYGYRHYWADRWAVHAELAPGIYELASPHAADAYQHLDHTFAAQARVGIDWVFGRLHEPTFVESDHGVGLLLTETWLPHATAEGRPASGTALALLVRYTFGT